VVGNGSSGSENWQEMEVPDLKIGRKWKYLSCEFVKNWK